VSASVTIFSSLRARSRIIVIWWLKIYFLLQLNLNRPTEKYSLNSGNVDFHTASSYISGLTSHNANNYTLKAVCRITGRWKQRNKKVGETPQNKSCEEVLKLYVWVEGVLGALKHCKSNIHQLGSSSLSVIATVGPSIYPIFIITPYSKYVI
jgi:hypothetical protein